MLRILILTVVTVSAKRISTDIHDHYPAQPKIDVGSFGDGRFEDFGDRDVKDVRDAKDSGDRNVKTEFSSRSFGEKHKPGNPEYHEYSSFNTHFKHHHFRHSSNGQDNARDFGSQNRGFGSGFVGQSEFRNRGINEHTHKDIESGFRQSTDETRSRGIETLGHEFGSETFGNDKRQHVFDRDIEDHGHRSIGQDSSFQGSSHRFYRNFGPDNFGTHSSQARSIDHNTHRNLNNRFDQNSNVQRADQGLESENTEHKHTHLNSQNNKNKEEFEIISAANKQTFDNRNKENVNIRTPAHERQTSRTENKDSSNRNDKVEHNQNAGTKIYTNINTERRINSGSAENNSTSRHNQKHDIKTSIENEVTSKIPSVANKNNRTNQGKEAEGDRWIWSGDEQNKTEVTTVNPTIDDRAAFNGDRCPTGKIKVGNMCVDVD